jgi:hypothetical protein
MNKLQNFKPRNRQAGFLQFLPLIMGGLSLLGAKKAPKEQTTQQGGTSYGTQTSSTQLPPELMGAAQQALAQSGSLQGFGQQVAPTSPFVNQAANQLSAFASGGAINPHLDKVFNAGADATQNRLATEFSMSGAGGVNNPSHQQARSQELQLLAAQTYGQGHENERQRQFASQSPLVGVGQYLQQDQQQRMNAPWDSLNTYINQLGALSPFFPGTTTQTQSTNQQGSVTQPLYSNPMSAFAGGAMLGGALQPVLTGMGNRQPPTADNFVNPYGNPYSPWAMNGSMYG